MVETLGGPHDTAWGIPVQSEIDHKQWKPLSSSESELLDRQGSPLIQHFEAPMLSISESFPYSA